MKKNIIRQNINSENGRESNNTISVPSLLSVLVDKFNSRVYLHKKCILFNMSNTLCWSCIRYQPALVTVYLSLRLQLEYLTLWRPQFSYGCIQYNYVWFMVISHDILDKYPRIFKAVFLKCNAFLDLDLNRGHFDPEPSVLTITPPCISL